MESADTDPPLCFDPVDEARLKKMAKTNQTIVLYIAMHGGYRVVENEDNYGHDVTRFELPDKLAELHHVTIGSFAYINGTLQRNMWADRVQDYFSKNAVTKKNILFVAKFISGLLRKVMADKVDNDPDWMHGKTADERLAEKTIQEHNQQRKRKRGRGQDSVSPDEVRQSKAVVGKSKWRRESRIVQLNADDDERVHMKSYSFRREYVRNKGFSCVQDEIDKGMGMYVLNYPPYLKSKTPLTFDQSIFRESFSTGYQDDMQKIHTDVQGICKSFSDLGFENVVIIDPSCNGVQGPQRRRYDHDYSDSFYSQLIDDFNASVSPAKSAEFDRNVAWTYRKIKPSSASASASASAKQKKNPAKRKRHPSASYHRVRRSPSHRSTRKIKSA